MKTYISCYSKPLSEFSIPFEDKKHSTYGRKEIDCWLYQLKRTFPFSAKDFHIKEHFSEDGKLKVKFWEVVLEYEDTESQRERAFALVDELPYDWDYKSREFLGPDYFNYIMRLKCPKDFPDPIDPFQKEADHTGSN